MVENNGKNCLCGQLERVSFQVLDRKATADTFLVVDRCDGAPAPALLFLHHERAAGRNANKVAVIYRAHGVHGINSRNVFHPGPFYRVVGGIYWLEFFARGYSIGAIVLSCEPIAQGRKSDGAYRERIPGP